MTLIIVQARMGSTRLPGKVMKDILGRPVIFYLLERLGRCETISQTVVATSVDSNNDPLCRYLEKSKVEFYRGSENDVLDRYYQTAKKYQADTVVRITADCPLMDPQLIDQVVMEFDKKQVDYCCNVIERTFPDGLDIEVFTFNALEKVWQEAKTDREREHVTVYIRQHPEIFKAYNVKNSVNFGLKRWTLDTQDDLDMIKEVFEKIYPSNPNFNFQNLLEFFSKNPQIENINNKIKVN